MNIQATSATANASLKSIAATAAQEATETAAVTKAEAAKGDSQAIRKLAAQQQAVQQSASPEGIGKNIDLTK
jgi:hypothetical protein